MSIVAKRLYLVLVAIVLIILAGSIGYYLIFDGKYSLIDCVYMTVISLTTVGYGEVIEITGNIPAQIFTMILITFGAGVILYGISNLTAVFIEGELSGLLRAKQMVKRIRRLSGHHIVCGGGETGQPVMQELIQNNERVVLIENDPEKIDRCARLLDGLLFIKGDATEDQNLISAGLERAAGFFICLPSDKDALYVTITARMYNERIRIISRVMEEPLRSKLINAGANRVVSPSAIGALRMASEMIRPAAVDFLDRMLRSSQGNLRINELTISSSSSMAGTPVIESGLKERFELLLLASRKPGEVIQFNPLPEDTLEPGMTLIVMGDVENCARAKKVL